MFRTLLPLIPGPSAATLFAVQDTRAIALVQCRGRQMPYTYKPLSNPRPGMLLITYTYPCTLLYHNHLNLFSERTELKREMERGLTYLPYISAVCYCHREMTTNMAEGEEELKSLLMKMKVESEKVGLKLNIQKMKIMASHHFMGNRWGNSGNSVRLYIFGLQNHCRW